MCTEVVRVGILITRWFFFTQKVSLKTETCFQMISAWVTKQIHDQLAFIKMIHVTMLFHLFTPHDSVLSWTISNLLWYFFLLQPGCVEWIFIFSCSIMRMLNSASYASALDSQAGNSQALTGLGCPLPLEPNFKNVAALSLALWSNSTHILAA